MSSQLTLSLSNRDARTRELQMVAPGIVNVSEWSGRILVVCRRNLDSRFPKMTDFGYVARMEPLPAPFLR